MPDVQALVLWVLADGANPRWVFVKARHALVPGDRVQRLAFPPVTHTFGPRRLSLRRLAQNKPLVRHVVVVAIPGLCEHLVRSHQVSFLPSLPSRTSPCYAYTPRCCVSASLLWVCGKRDAR